MGKPSSTKLPKSEADSKASDQMSGIKKNPINGNKMDAQKKRYKRRTKKKISKLFDKLRNESMISINSSVSEQNTLNDTVVLIDDTIDSPSRKRKLSDSSIHEQRKIIRIDDSEPVIITDDDVVVKETEASCSKVDEFVTASCSYKTPKRPSPRNCSTPISMSNTDLINNNADTAQISNIDTNTTKEINGDSYLTIDLTTESNLNRTSVSKTENTVIDLDKTQDSQDCTFISISNASLSMSGDSDVTVLRTKSQKRVNRFVNGIAKLDASEKGRLLELITKNIFSGCKMPDRVKSNLNVKETMSKGVETAENTYIKEIILGEKSSRNSIGSNIYNPAKDQSNKTGLRMIVIDGSNVAMEYGKGRQFSVEGLKICIDYFLKRGHVVKAFVPRFRCKFGKSSSPRLLDELERQGLVVYTPSREIQGRMITSYDDRYIVQCAAEFDAVIVSGDNYRDLSKENPRWRTVIETRLLPFTWVNNMIMFPKDPLGRYGPTLEQFLRHPETVTSSIVFGNAHK